jgi:GT2 family glycosyltransferase
LLATFSKNLGYTGANNLASQFARGKWLIFLNNDTHLHPDFLVHLAHAVVNRPSAHILVPTIKNYDGTTPGEHHFVLDILGYPTQRIASDPFWGHGCALTVRRDVFASLGGFDDDYFIFSRSLIFAGVRRLPVTMSSVSQWYFVTTTAIQDFFLEEY